jgi:hypothetical protein
MTEATERKTKPVGKLAPATQAVLERAAQRVPADRRTTLEGISAASLQAVALEWKEEVRGAPSTEFVRGIRNCIQALEEIVEDLEGKASA